MEQRSQEWHDARKGKMSCSRMGEAIGLIGSRRRLWRELTGREGPKPMNAAMQDGVDYEQVALSEYALATGNSVDAAGFIVHRDHDWIGGSPDGVIPGINDTILGGVEVKCPTKMYESIPDRYMPQIQGLMEVLDVPYWDFVVWTADATRGWRVFRSTAYWDELYALLCEFWTFIETDSEPPVYERGSKPRITSAVRIEPLI